MTMSNLTSYVRISPNTSGIRTSAISKVIVHHMAGDCSVEVCGEIFANPNRQASSNYGVGSDGRVACYLEEEYHPWTSGSYWADDRGVTIECADYDLDAWSPSSAAYESTVMLCADICDRYGIAPSYTGGTDGTFVSHWMFQSTSCPGPWWRDRMPAFVEDVKSAMRGEFDMTLDELLNDKIATADDGQVPIWQLWSWSFTHARRAEKKCDDILARIDKVQAGNIDYSALAKAVCDEQAKRMKA